MGERPQFGVADPGLRYEDRPCAFGVVERDGRIGLVKVGLPHEDQHFDLPGGAVDPGEDEAAALVREFGEETGLVVRAGALLGRADQFVIKKDGRPVNNRSALMTVDVLEHDGDLKIEHDHELVWLDPLEALRRIRHGSHAWAIACWLRTRS